MDKATYLHDPCGASSLPFWKTNAIRIPPGLLVLREDDPRLNSPHPGYIDTPFFKLIHPMKQIERPSLPDGFRFVTPELSALCAHIHDCYAQEGLSEAELDGYRRHPGYASDLWLAILDEKDGRMVASGIAEVDKEIREGILEWIQVSPNYRRRGFGKLIVQELLYRMKGRAAFVTVSGKAEDPFYPCALYARCGFEGMVVWHILKKRIGLS